MQPYHLQPHEVLLLKSKARYTFDGSYPREDFAGRTVQAEVLATSLSLVLQASYRRLFQTVEHTMELGWDELKWYKGWPLIRLKGSDLYLDFISASIHLHFSEASKAREMENVLLDHLTHTTQMERNVQKISSDVISGIRGFSDTVAPLVGSALNQGLSNLGGLFSGSSRQTDPGKQEMLDKLYDLYQSGLLSKKEYEEKRRQVLEEED